MPGTEAIPTSDRGVLGSVYDGDQRQCTLQLDVWFTAASLDANELLALLTTASSDGLKPTVDLRAIFYDAGQQGGAGISLTFANCYLPDGYSGRAASGSEMDRITLSLVSNSTGPTKADVS